MLYPIKFNIIQRLPVKEPDLPVDTESPDCIDKATRFRNSNDQIRTSRESGEVIEEHGG